MSKVTSINQITLLNELLKSDIQSLSEMNVSKFSKGLSDMIRSLIEIKKTVINLLPGKKMDAVHTVTTPANLELASYSGTPLKNNEIHIVKICLKVETDQMIFVKNNINCNGIPNSVKDSLKKILSIYQSTTDRLQRMISTSQIMEIVA